VRKIHVHSWHACNVCYSHRQSTVSTISYLHVSKTHLHIDWRDVSVHHLRGWCIWHSWYWHWNGMPLTAWYPTTIVSWSLKRRVSIIIALSQLIELRLLHPHKRQVISVLKMLCWRTEQLSHLKQLLKNMVHLHDKIAACELTSNGSESSPDVLNCLGIETRSS